MKKIILILEFIAALINFAFLIKIDPMFSICVLIFSSVLLFGVFEKDSDKINAHLMVGGGLLFLLSIFSILYSISKLELPEPSYYLTIIIGLCGLLQAIFYRKRFK